MRVHASVRLAPAERGGLGLIALAAVLWGTIGVANRAVSTLAETTPISVGFFRMAFAVPALLVAAWLTLGGGLLRASRRDLALMALSGAMLAAYQACFFAAIARIGVAASTLVTLCTAPVLVALLSLALLGERPGGRVLLALVSALAGTALLVDLRQGEGGGGDALLGVLLALGSALGYAVLALAGRSLAGRCHPLRSLAIGFSVGAALLLAAALPGGLAVSYPAAGWGILLYMGLVPSALGYVCFLWGMRRATATTASIVTLLEPLTATLLAALLFGERLGPLGLLGALLLLGALGLLSAGGRSEG